MCVCARGEAGPLSVCCVEELPSLKIVTGIYVISSPVVKQCVHSVLLFSADLPFLQISCLSTYAQLVGIVLCV